VRKSRFREEQIKGGPSYGTADLPSVTIRSDSLAVAEKSPAPSSGDQSLSFVALGYE
jgi:hypothetical protein